MARIAHSTGKFSARSKEGESMEEYKACCKEAYGNLKNVRFAYMGISCDHDAVYAFTGQCADCDAQNN